LFAPYYAAPAELERSVRDALRRAAPNEPRAEVRSVPWRWIAIAASILLVMSVSWNIRPLQRRTSENELVAQNIVSDHIRSLIGTHLLDVTSSDQHTVTWPSDSSPVSRSHFTRNGYGVVHWSHGAMTFWAVSDITIAELEQFEGLNER
jgi:anti-sigma factor RsiW